MTHLLSKPEKEQEFSGGTFCTCATENCPGCELNLLISMKQTDNFVNLDLFPFLLFHFTFFFIFFVNAAQTT